MLPPVPLTELLVLLLALALVVLLVLLFVDASNIWGGMVIGDW